MEKEALNNSHVQYREITAKENKELFWTKAFLQTSLYDDKRYRQIASNACQRIVRKFSIVRSIQSLYPSSFRRRNKSVIIII